MIGSRLHVRRNDAKLTSSQQRVTMSFQRLKKRGGGIGGWWVAAELGRGPPIHKRTLYLWLSIHLLHGGLMSTDSFFAVRFGTRWFG